jgi:hypothetical protein
MVLDSEQFNLGEGCCIHNGTIKQLLKKKESTKESRNSKTKKA